MPIPGADWWDGAAKLITAGPIGLGAILILVTGLILIASKSIEQGKLRATLSMLLAGCFLVVTGFGVLVFQGLANRWDLERKVELAKASVKHRIYFEIQPLFLGSKPSLPLPRIKIKNKELKEFEYEVDSDITATIDVKDALDEAASLARQNGSKMPERNDDQEYLEQVKRNRERFAANLDTTAAQLQRVVELVSQSCPGGSRGQNPANFPSVLALTNSVQSTLQDAKHAVLTADF